MHESRINNDSINRLSNDIIYAFVKSNSSDETCGEVVAVSNAKRSLDGSGLADIVIHTNGDEFDGGYLEQPNGEYIGNIIEFYLVGDYQSTYNCKLLIASDYMGHYKWTTDYTRPVNPVRAWSNPPHTIVQFADGSKVVVKCEDGKPYDFFAGFCIALGKKRFGSATALNNAFKACQEEANRRKYDREARNHFAKFLKKEKSRYAKELRESKIRKRMEELRIEREAQRRMDDKEKEENNG